MSQEVLVFEKYVLRANWMDVQFDLPARYTSMGKRPFGVHVIPVYGGQRSLAYYTVHAQTREKWYTVCTDYRTEDTTDAEALLKDELGANYTGLHSIDRGDLPWVLWAMLLNELEAARAMNKSGLPETLIHEFVLTQYSGVGYMLRTPHLTFSCDFDMSIENSARISRARKTLRAAAERDAHSLGALTRNEIKNISAGMQFPGTVAKILRLCRGIETKHFWLYLMA